MKEATSASEDKGVGSGRESDVADDSRNREKDDRKGKEVGTWASREYSGDIVKREEKS